MTLHLHLRQTLVASVLILFINSAGRLATANVWSANFYGQADSRGSLASVQSDATHGYLPSENINGNTLPLTSYNNIGLIEPVPSQGQDFLFGPDGFPGPLVEWSGWTQPFVAINDFFDPTSSTEAADYYHALATTATSGAAIFFPNLPAGTYTFAFFYNPKDPGAEDFVTIQHMMGSMESITVINLDDTIWNKYTPIASGSGSGDIAVFQQIQWNGATDWFSFSGSRIELASVQVSAIPEPASWILLLLAMSVFKLRRTRL
jgi:hypothetical protein